MENAGALIRVSTPGQLDNTSPDTQLTAIKRVAEQHGFMIDPLHIWIIAESGKKTYSERLGFELVESTASHKEISRLYVFNVKRLARNVLSGLIFINKMMELSCDIYSVENNQLLNTNDMSTIMNLMFSQYDGQSITRQTYQGLKDKVRAGIFSGGIVAYGYYLDPRTKKLEINEEEAKVVRLIYRLCVDEHMSSPKIADYLNATHVPTKFQLMPNPEGKRRETTGKWRYGRIRNMIINTSYRGFWEWGKRSKKPDHELIGNTCPAIVSEDTWYSAQKVLRSNRLFKPTGIKNKYLLRGLIKCVYCKHNYCGYYSKLYNGTTRRYYKCNGRTQMKRMNEQACDSPTFNADELEDIVWTDILDYCRRPESIVANIRKQRDEIDVKRISKELKEIEKENKNLEIKKDNLLDLALGSTRFSKQKLDEKAEEIDNEITLLMNRKNRLQQELGKSNQINENIIQFELWLSQMQTRIEHATWEEKREAVVYLVERIEASWEIVDDKEHPHVEIFYRFQRPDSISQDSVIMNLTDRGSWLR
jgi:site-specific DNA recombinase